MYDDFLFTESSLTDSVLYKSFNTNAAMTTTIMQAVKKSIDINEDYLQEQILQMKRTSLTTLVDDVLEAFNDGRIKLLYSTANVKIPQALPLVASKVGGKNTIFVFMNNFGTISKSDKNSNDKYFNISMKDLYALLEGAYTYLSYIEYPQRFKKSLGLMKLSAAIYTNMFVRILNREYAISIDADLDAKVSFAIGYFFLKRVYESENDDVCFSYAYSTISNERARGINRAELAEISNDIDKNEIYDIKNLIEYISTFSPKLKGCNFRYFVQSFINMFKPTSMFAMEYLPYFLFVVQASMIGSFIINRDIILDICKNIKGMNGFYAELNKVVS